MLGTPMIEVAIALGFFYALLSLVCSSITEGISTVLSLRARGLRDAIARMFGEDSAGEGYRKILDHPLIRSFGPRRFWKTVDRVPDYLPSEAFARTLLDILPTGTPNSAEKRPQTVEDLNAIVANLPSPDLRRALQAILPGASDLDAARKHIEAWYDNAMDSARSSYSRRARWINLGAAAIVVGCLNADTLMMTDVLWRNGNLRTAIVAEAEIMTSEGEETRVELTSAQAGDLLLHFPLGWHGSAEGGDPRSLPSDLAGVLRKILGLIVTTLAVSLGAPFWFDLLNRLVNLRSGGKPLPTASDLAESAAKKKSAGS